MRSHVTNGTVKLGYATIRPMRLSAMPEIADLRVERDEQDRRRHEVGDQHRAGHERAPEEAETSERVRADGADGGGQERAADGHHDAVPVPAHELGLLEEMRVVLAGERVGPEHRREASHLRLALERRDRHPVEGEEHDQQQRQQDRVGDCGLEAVRATRRGPATAHHRHAGRRHRVTAPGLAACSAPGRRSRTRAAGGGRARPRWPRRAAGPRTRSRRSGRAAPGWRRRARPW